VPTYEYHCDDCGREFEVRQRISADPLTTCDVCGGAVRRLLSAAPFILKGEGWYVTDYPSAARKKAMESEKGGAKSPAPATEKSTSETSGSEKTSASGKSAPASDSASSSSSSSPSAPSAAPSSD
jgi:putative FmdB family regulatory protein